MDLGSISAAVLRTGPLAARDDRVALSLRLIGSVLDGRARLADLSPDLAHDLRAAQPNSLATLILPAGPGPARVDIDGRQYPIPAALRDALIDAAKLTASEARLNAAPSPAFALKRRARRNSGYTQTLCSLSPASPSVTAIELSSTICS